MSKINDENYFQVSGWMLNRLHLKGTELCVYAIIYGFSQEADSWFTGSRRYLADFVGVSTVTIDNTLASLVQKGLLEKQENYNNGVKFNRYKAITNFDTLQKNCTPPLQKTLTNNKDNIIKRNNIYMPFSEDAPIEEKPKPAMLEIKARVNTLFHRRETTSWTAKETAQLKEIAQRPGVLDEMAEIEQLYNSGYEYRRRDILTFLNNWTIELDRSRNDQYSGKTTREINYVPTMF